MVLNCIQHLLTNEQVTDLSRKGEVIHLSNIAPDLFKELCDCPNDYETLERLANSLIHVLVDYKQILFIHFPIGSPAFQCLFYKRFFANNVVSNRVFITFSQTKRISTETINDDGTTTKTSTFKFNGTINI